MTDVAFLAQLAAGGSADRLEGAWQDARGNGLAPLRRSASRTGLLPALGRFLAARKTSDPSETELAAVCFAAEERSAAQTRLLSEAATAAGSVSGIALKAAALVLSGLYEPGERQAVDADLLVAVTDLTAWKHAFEIAGASWYLLPRNGYEVAAAVRGSAIVEIHTALPEASGRRAGIAFDEILARSAPSHVPAIFIPDRAACREIAVHHFVFHHLGSADHALRVIQDLSRLEDDSGDEPARLSWRGASPSAALVRLRRVARRLRGGELADPETARFLSGLEIEILRERPALPFSESAASILDSERALGRSTARTILAALTPPPDRLRRKMNEPVAVTAIRYLARPFSLAGRWITSRPSRAERSRRMAWRRFLAGN